MRAVRQQSVRVSASSGARTGVDGEDDDGVGRGVVASLAGRVWAYRGGGDAVLSGARLGDDALLSEAQREQALTDGVVDLVRAGEGELLALEPNLRAAAVLGQTLRVVERRRPANVLGAHLLHLRLRGRESTARASGQRHVTCAERRARERLHTNKWMRSNKSRAALFLIAK
eukprot:4712894-Pleurochrysis_carterae.AAC.2